ncbi:MAG: TOBE domain-containing protein [Methylocystaceae bacterium]|nr:TOBE domain-containing protein [Methylocystaceae bacterium]
MSDQLVVMEGGSVRQIGSAQDLYERPTDSFVADFVGRSNVIGGQIEDGVFRAFDGTELLQSNGPIDPAAKFYTIRPDKIKLSRAHTGLTAEVHEVLYLGALTEYTVMLGQNALSVVTATPAPDDDLYGLRRGDPINVHWDTTFANLLTE